MSNSLMAINRSLWITEITTWIAVEMVSLTEDQLKVKALLAETVTLLCKNGLKFSSELRIEGLIGVTVDNNKILLVNINEAVRSASTAVLPSYRRTAGKVRQSRTCASREGTTISEKRCVVSTSQKYDADGDTMVITKRAISGNSSDNLRLNSDEGSYAIAGDSLSFSSCSSRSAKKRKRRLSSEPEQTLTLLVEDELLGDTGASDFVKSEGNASDDSDIEPDEQMKIADVYSAVTESQDAECSTWPTEQGTDRAGGSPTKVSFFLIST